MKTLNKSYIFSLGLGSQLWGASDHVFFTSADLLKTFHATEWKQTVAPREYLPRSIRVVSFDLKRSGKTLSKVLLNSYNMWGNSINDALQRRNPLTNMLFGVKIPLFWGETLGNSPSKFDFVLFSKLLNKDFVSNKSTITTMDDLLLFLNSAQSVPQNNVMYVYNFVHKYINFFKVIPYLFIPANVVRLQGGTAYFLPTLMDDLHLLLRFFYDPYLDHSFGSFTPNKPIVSRVLSSSGMFLDRKFVERLNLSKIVFLSNFINNKVNGRVIPNSVGNFIDGVLFQLFKHAQRSLWYKERLGSEMLEYFDSANSNITSSTLFGSLSTLQNSLLYQMLFDKKFIKQFDVLWRNYLFFINTIDYNEVVLSHRRMSAMRFVAKYVFKRVNMLVAYQPSLIFSNLEHRIYADAYEKFPDTLNIGLFYEPDFQYEIRQNVLMEKGLPANEGAVQEGVVISAYNFKRLYLNLPQFYMWDVDLEFASDFDNSNTLDELLCDMQYLGNWGFSIKESELTFKPEETDGFSWTNDFPDIVFSGFDREASKEHIKVSRAYMKIKPEPTRYTHDHADPVNRGAYSGLRAENRISFDLLAGEPLNEEFTDSALRARSGVGGATSYSVDYLSRGVPATGLHNAFIVFLSNKFRRV